MSINRNNETLNEILSIINNLPSSDGVGGGITYTNIVYNDDNTITLTDKDGVDHIMTCEYKDGSLTALTYDGKSIALTYEEDALVGIGAVEVDMVSAPCESGGGGTEEIENIIDASGVLDSTEGTVEDKVGVLIDLAKIKSLINEGLQKNTGFGGMVFSKTGITDLSIFDFSYLTSFQDVFNGCYALIYAKLNPKSGGTFQRTFANCTLLEEVEFESVPKGTYDGTFQYCSALKTVSKMDFSNATTNTGTRYTFFKCTALENIDFVKESISKSLEVPSAILSANSKNSLFNGLAYVTTAQTLTLHKDAKILQSQVDSANAKGWTVAGGTVVSEEEYYA